MVLKESVVFWPNALNLMFCRLDFGVNVRTSQLRVLTESLRIWPHIRCLCPPTVSSSSICSIPCFAIWRVANACPFDPLPFLVAFSVHCRLHCPFLPLKDSEASSSRWQLHVICIYMPSDFVGLNIESSLTQCAKIFTSSVCNVGGALTTDSTIICSSIETYLFDIFAM